MNIDSSMKQQQQLNNNDNDVNQKQQKLRKEQRKQIVLHRALLTIPYFIGILWTTVHPILSVITGELKCRGQYIDENGLDVHRHRVESYPLQRRRSVAVADAPRLVTSSSYSFVVRGGGMCQSIKLHSNSISPSIECFHHVASSAISFDIVRILPPMGPMIESSEAIVIVVGGNHNNNKEYKYDDDDHPRNDSTAAAPPTMPVVMMMMMMMVILEMTPPLQLCLVGIDRSTGDNSRKKKQ